MGLKQAKIIYREILALLKKENIKTSLSTVKKIGLKYKREGSIHRKWRSGFTSASTSKDDDRLKLTVLKQKKTTFAKISKKI